MEELGRLDQGLISRSMKTVAKRGLLVLLGLVGGTFFTFARRIIIVRTLSKAEYGLYALGISIIYFATMVAMLGLATGTQRHIAFYRGEGDMARAKGTFYSALILLAFSVVVVTGALVVGAEPLSDALEKPGLAWVLVVMSVMLPTTAVLNIIVSLFQGFESVTAKVAFREIGLAITTTGGVVLVAIVGGGLRGMVLAMVSGYVITTFALAAYTLLRFPPRLKTVKASLETRALLWFSLPLALAAGASALMHETDTLMLGYFTTASNVGVYNAAVPIYQMMGVFLIATQFIYTPVAARLVGARRNNELRELYTSITKWQFVLTLPAWLLCFCFPGETLGLLFGERYAGAAVVLQLLMVGEFFKTFLGPNGTTLISYGKTRLFMAYIIIAACCNIALNWALIPRFGIDGAAIATAVSAIIMNILASVQIFRSYRIHPFHMHYLVPVCVSMAVSTALYYPLRLMLDLTVWILPVFYFFFLAITLGSVVLTRSVDETDSALYGAVRERARDLLKRRQ